MNLSPIIEEDYRFLFDLRNDKIVRQNMVNTDSFTYPEHVAYLKENLKDLDFHIYLGVVRHKKIGYIKLKKIDGVYDVSFVVAPEHQKQGYAKKMLKRVSNVFKPIQAVVREDNIASIKVVESCGFRRTLTKDGFHYYGQTQ